MKKTEIFVTSYTGEKVLMSECRCIHHVYYIKNKECFLIDGKWYRINSGLITLNHSTGKYILTSQIKNLINGVVGFEKIKPLTGYFTENIYDNVYVYDPNTNQVLTCLNESICKKALLPFDYKLGVYIIKPTTESGHINLDHRRKNYISDYKHNLAYRAENSLEKYLSLFLKYYKIKEPKSGISDLVPYSWGMEFETQSGVIPQHLVYRHGLIPLRDGSISGLEYATVPLRGEVGIQNTLDVCTILSQYTNTDLNCSFHVHLGGYERSISSILALYILGVSLQDNMYSYFPSWFINTGTYKRRSYVGPLCAVSTNYLKATPTNSEFNIFSKLYKWYSGGKSFVSLDEIKNPNDPQGEHKWTIEQRYTWLNLVPLIFSNRGTVEFRVHPPTSNPIKVINWLLVCSSILQYAEKHQEEIISAGYKPITLPTILNYVFPRNIATY